MGHSPHFERELSMTASPHERRYPAVIGLSDSCHNRTHAAQQTPLLIDLLDNAD